MGYSDRILFEFGLDKKLAKEINKNYPLTVVNLPSAAAHPYRRGIIVIDANATTFASIVAGGGSNTVPIYSDGTNWRIG